MKDEYLREAYAEEMFERRANDFETISFAEWKRRREAIAKLFEELESK